MTTIFEKRVRNECEEDESLEGCVSRLAKQLAQQIRFRFLEDFEAMFSRDECREDESFEDCQSRLMKQLFLQVKLNFEKVFRDY